MLEVYGFLAMFAVQTIVLTIAYPKGLIGRVRAQLGRYPAERFPQLYPGGAAQIDRQLRIYRMLNAAVAVGGLALLGWFYTYMQRPDWDDGPVEAWLGVFFALQMIPIVLFAWASARTQALVRRSLQEQPRKAVLERRSLFDFISPFTVVVALACYPSFIGYVLFIARHPFPGFAGVSANIAVITALYAATALAVYLALYGKKSSPVQSQSDRKRTIELTVKVSVYTCLAAVAFLSLNFTLVLLDLQPWEPLAQSAFFVACALLYLSGMNAGMIGPPSELDVDRLRSRPA